MSCITGPDLFRTPKGYPERWKRVFEAIVAPVELVRAIASKALRNSSSDPCLSPEEFKGFQDEALKMWERMLEVLEQINGVAERTWRAGSDIGRDTCFVIGSLNELNQPYPEHMLEKIRKGIIIVSTECRPIPSIIKLREAIASEKSIVLPVSIGDGGTALVAQGGKKERAHATPSRLSDELPGVSEAEPERATLMSKSCARPTQYLLGWRQILDALDQKNYPANQNSVRQLNKQYDGPIILPGQGGQPKVNKEKLLEWWNGLDQQFRESQQKRADSQATVYAQHKYGRDGMVFPNISGHVRKRRKKLDS